MRAVLIAAALLTSAAPAMALAQTAPTVAAPASAFERDRQAILAQAGQYRVHFDMRETVSFNSDYDPMEGKLSGGSEIVRVVYDHGDRISLQHILVMEHDGKAVVIKHWRQDWTYQPETVLTYAGPNQWTLSPVSADQREGAWSQTVWQTDDSPRYGGVGRWTYVNGMTVWTSEPTWRPLARRDAVLNPIYDRYLGTNRHALTPNGWVHIQDNMKMSGRAGGEPVAIVQEDVVNTYDRSTSYSPKAGDDYWAATKAYWAAVRDAWDAVIVRDNGIRVQEEAQTGVVTGPALMALAQKVQDGALTTDAAIAQARATIDLATKR
ncbi:hypothetical protein QE419_002535 [Brevundimonas vesicularis]|uniref:DUF6607 family protein n=1 Tax=Brevundimonas vesicularis TaxID=41276 RepID=UPI00278855A4|nr:DUF6607 family protein [Brevundimonas vesicularis]MDQ1193769.1 hypothetical protein [Brevundimonas vesicularis]